MIDNEYNRFLVNNRDYFKDKIINYLQQLPRTPEDAYEALQVASSNGDLLYSLMVQGHKSSVNSTVS